MAYLLLTDGNLGTIEDLMFLDLSKLKVVKIVLGKPNARFTLSLPFPQSFLLLLVVSPLLSSFM